MLLALVSAAAAAEEPQVHATQRGADRFIAGDTATVSQPVKGDLFAAGGEMRVLAPVGGDALAAGGSVRVEGSVGEDLYAAGGEVAFDGTVAGNARVAGGSVSVGRNARIDGNASLAGGRVAMLGMVGGYLHVAGGRVLIDGPVEGDVEAAAGELELGPAARIQGELRYRARDPLRRDPAAQVKGNTERIEWDGYDEASARAAVGAAFGAWLLGVMLLAAVLTLFFPRYAGRIVLAVRQRFGWSALVGFLALVAVPPALVILLVTVVGIPLAVLGVLLYPVLLLVGYAAAGIALGGLALPRWHSRPKRAIAAALGVLVISLLVLVPWAGALLAFLALITGMGALLVSLREPRAG